MKEKHSKRLMMFENVIQAMDAHLKTWIGVPELSRTYDEFVRKYKKLADLKLEEDNDIRPFIDRYMERRKGLITKMIPVTAVVSVYAYDRKDPRLEKKTSLSEEQMMKFSDKALLELADLLIKTGPKPREEGSLEKKKEGKKNKDQNKPLEEYGLTPSMIQDLKDTRKELDAAKKAVKDAQKFKEKCASDIARISKSNNALLKNRMDRLVKLFKVSEPGFYNDYQVARELKKEDVKKEKVQTKPASQKPAVGPGKSEAVKKTASPRKPAAKTTASSQGSSRTAGKKDVPKEASKSAAKQTNRTGGRASGK